MLNKTTFSLPLLLALSGAACGSLDIGDLNDPGLDEFQTNPRRETIAAAATGLLVQARINIGAANGYVSHLGILGRESYNFDIADPRYIGELLEGDLQPGNNAFGGNFWLLQYRNIRNANILLGALETPMIVGVDDKAKEATRGFAKTIMALEHLVVINTRDDNGAVIQKSADPRVLEPISTKAEVFAHIKALLDEAKTHLLAGGDSFPFPLGSGFAGFDTPMTFLKANRALRARVDVYSGDNAGALTALGESFLTADPAMPNFGLGIYHAFGSGPGDQINLLNDPNQLAHPSIKAGAEMTANGQPDARVVAKLKMVDSRSVSDLTSDQAFTLYDSPTARIPIIRNEELILLRAEASAATGNLMQAIADVNFIREKSGGLAPRTDLTMANILDEILKQRFYSLVYEGGHRWLDARRHGRLEQLPKDKPTHKIHAKFPIPQDEINARMPPE
jgi:starch-binding outer membrane protein, SusD/RagB family